MDNCKRISQALMAVDAAQQRLNDTITEICAPGTNVTYGDGRHQQSGVVIRTAGARVRVRNNRTGKEYYIHAYRLLRTYGGSFPDEARK